METNSGSYSAAVAHRELRASRSRGRAGESDPTTDSITRLPAECNHAPLELKCVPARSWRLPEELKFVLLASEVRPARAPRRPRQCEGDSQELNVVPGEVIAHRGKFNCQPQGTQLHIAGTQLRTAGTQTRTQQVTCEPQQLDRSPQQLNRRPQELKRQPQGLERVPHERNRVPRN
jgi:hypothetical protein